MPDCDRDAWWEFRPDGEHAVSLHDFEEVEVIEGVTIQLLRCKRCGALSIDGGEAVSKTDPMSNERRTRC